MANATLGKDEILEAIGNMKVSELVELTEAFKSDDHRRSRLGY